MATKKQRQEAQLKLQSLKAPTYVSPYQKQIDALVSDINNRKPFSYDFAADPVYHQYRERYQDQGKLAMQDTVAASAALTGGYGNSYGTTAGSLAYQEYLKGLNDVIPQLHDSAYAKYSGDTADMYNRLQMMQGEEDRAYNRYQQQLANYMDELSYWSSIASSGGGGSRATGTGAIGTLDDAWKIYQQTYNPMAGASNEATRAHQERVAMELAKKYDNVDELMKALQAKTNTKKIKWK